MFVFKNKTTAQLKQNHYKRDVSGLNGFLNFSDYEEWYLAEEKVCKYCGIKEEEVQEIVSSGLLKSKRFPDDGNVKRGRSRGMWLEVDRFDPNGMYSRENSVLACYFCNNDKSDVFYGNQYIDFFQNRLSFLRKLLKK